MNPKRFAFWPSDPIERSAAPLRRPEVVCVREGSAGPEGMLDEPPRILIVEDDFLVASEMEGALSQAGFAVAGVASSAQQALELAAAQPLALAVMDVRLAGKRDGIDAALELFAKHGIRCVFATAHHTAGTLARARPARPLNWLAKPYSMSSLVDAVRHGLRDLDRQEN